MTTVTKTTGRLHFDDLDPLRFEDLCVNIVCRLYEWKNLYHFGRKGNDDGVDISGVLSHKGKEQTWHIQCKRYKSVTKRDIKAVIDRIVQSEMLPQKLLLIIACDLSKSLIQYFEKMCGESGIEEHEIWTASILEAKIYSKYPDVLFTFFGINHFQEREKNIQTIKHALEMERRMEVDFVDQDYMKNRDNWIVLRYLPSNKFISSRVIIRSVDDKTYPSCESSPKGEISPWFRVHLYNFYNDGIEVWLNAVHGTVAIFDSEGRWEPIKDFLDPRVKSPDYSVVPIKWIGRIPFKSIVEYKIKGDEYYSDPHIYVKFEHDNMPYEEIYYKIEGDPANKVPDWPLSKDMQTIFPKTI